jgi:hypothetical protein
MQSPYGSFFTQCAAFQVFNHSFQISTPHFSPCRLSQGGGGGGKGARCESAAQIRSICKKTGCKLLKEAVVFEPTKSGLGVIGGRSQI